MSNIEFTSSIIFYRLQRKFVMVDVMTIMIQVKSKLEIKSKKKQASN